MKTASARQRRAAEPSEAECAAAVADLGVTPASNLIAVLQEVQGRFGYLPAPALGQIGRRMRVPLSRIWGVLSFYAQFYTEPRGRHTVRCCRGTACHVRGAKRVIAAVESRLHLREGETSEDLMFSFETVACLGACALSPVVVVDGTYYGKVTPKRVGKVLDAILQAESAAREAE
jgi:NADH:ubiquinone oxidoreductase subunit E